MKVGSDIELIIMSVIVTFADEPLNRNNPMHSKASYGFCCFVALEHKVTGSNPDHQGL